MTDQVRVLGISCSPSIGGKTRAAIEAVLAGSVAAGAEASVIELGPEPDFAAAAAAVADADAVVFGSPMYRATYAAAFKSLTEAIPRTPAGEGPLRGKAVTTVGTGGSDHHMLGTAGMRDILVDFFSAHVVSPGLYVSAAGFSGDHLTEDVGARADALGRGLVELAAAIASSSGLRNVAPNA